MLGRRWILPAGNVKSGKRKYKTREASDKSVLKPEEAKPIFPPPKYPPDTKKIFFHTADILRSTWVLPPG